MENNNNFKKLLKRTYDKSVNRINQNMIAKECDRKLICLQLFLLDVIRFNGQELGMPNVNNESVQALYYTVHNNVPRFRYEIIVPKKPPFRKPEFKQVLQGYCNQTALGYGVYGLNVMYGKVFAVFIDRVIYDGLLMTIDIIHIDNENAMNYCREAVKRDRKQLKNEERVSKLLKILSS